MKMKKIYFGFLIAVLSVFIFAAPALAAETGENIPTVADDENEGVEAENSGSENTDVLGNTGGVSITTVSEDEENGEEEGNEESVVNPTDPVKGDNAKLPGVNQANNGSYYYYDKNGAVDESVSGVVKKDGTWYYFEDGRVVPGKEIPDDRVKKNSNGWWYINDDGIVDFKYTGFAHNTNGWWYLEKSKVTFSTNSVIKDTNGAIDDNNSWWYVVGSKVQYYGEGSEDNFTGLADYKNNNGWWYITDGRVNFQENTVAKNKNGWWYVEDSKVIFSYTGFAENENGYWYIENGKVTFNKNSVIKDTKGAIGTSGTWWYVVGSKVQTTHNDDKTASYTGVANYKNSNGWWYIEDGVVTFKYSGFGHNKNGWWYVENSKVTFNKNDVIEDTDGLIKSAGSLLYVVGSKVQTSYTGLSDYKCSDNNYWYYFTNGVADTTYTGVATNKNGGWYIQNGVVNFSYTGTYTASDGTKYTVSGGSVENLADSTMVSKAKSLSSSTKYLILVDTTKNRIGIFTGSKGNWSCLYYWQCSTGASSTPTPKGTFTVKSKGKSFGTSYTCWYYTQFYGSYLFHSVLYYHGSMTKIMTGTLGKNISHGCVRLAIENAKWIYDNIPKGTKVVTY